MPGAEHLARYGEAPGDVGERLGWTVISMVEDWEQVFAPDDR